MNDLHIIARVAQALLSAVIVAGIALVFQYGHSII